MIRRIVAAATLCMLLSAIAVADGGKLETIGAFSGEGASDSLKNAIGSRRASASCSQTAPLSVKSG